MTDKKIETWGDFKKAVEAAGLTDDSRLAFIDTGLWNVGSVHAIDTDGDGCYAIFDGDLIE